MLRSHIGYIMDQDYSNVQFSPAMPIPIEFDVQERIKELRSYLDPTNASYERIEQPKNIRVAITFYEEGRIDGINLVFIVDGKITSWEDVGKETVHWI